LLNMKKNSLFLLFFIVLFSVGNIATMASAPTSTPIITTSQGGLNNPAKIDSTVEKQIIDMRCTREKLFRGVEEAGQPPSEYSKICCEEKNTETMIECMEALYPTYDKGSLWGSKGFNYLGTDVVITRETLPLIIRMVLTVVFALFVAYYLFIAFKGFYEYLTAASESQNFENAQKYFTSALIGLLVGGGGILFTYIIFYAFGFRGDPFSFDEIFDKSFLIDCDSITTQEWCGKYDISCSWAGGACTRVDPEVQSDKRDALTEGSFCNGYVLNFCENTK
jgi:hypothetical protein